MVSFVAQEQQEESEWDDSSPRAWFCLASLAGWTRCVLAALRCAWLGCFVGRQSRRVAGMRTGLDLRRVMVGTGRFELPHGSTPLRGVSPPSQAGLDAHPLRYCAWLGCFVDRQSRRVAGMLTVLDLRRVMVGTGRFELPTPRTPSECSTRLSHVPTQWSRLG